MTRPALSSKRSGASVVHLRALRTLLPRAAALALPLAIVACAHEPLEYIPANDRAMLQAQARLGLDSGEHRSEGVSVKEMLMRARGTDGGAPGVDADDAQARRPGDGVGGTKLEFADGQLQPTDAQRQQLLRMASAVSGAGGATVVTHPEGLQGASPLLGERRAMTVAHILEASVPKVDVRFDPDMPAGEVIVVAGIVATDHADQP